MEWSWYDCVMDENPYHPPNNIDNPLSKSRRQVTFVAIFVILAMVFVLMWVLIPAIQAARERVRRRDRYQSMPRTFSERDERHAP